MIKRDFRKQGEIEIGLKWDNLHAIFMKNGVISFSTPHPKTESFEDDKIISGRNF